MCFRLHTESFIDLSQNLITLDESSEQAEFLAANCLSGQRRSKLWRTGGFFKVESGSNTIVFQEDGATDLTATVAAGSYTSISSFLTAVATAFDSVGASTYTITQGSDLRINITSDGLGGSGTLDILWTDPSSAALAGIMGFSTASDDTGALTYTADLIRLHTEERLTFDLGVPANPQDFVMVSGDRNAAIKLSPSATLKLQASMTNNFTGTPPVDISLSYDDETIFTSNDDGLAGAGNQYRFWSVSLVDIDNANGYIEVGALFLGNHLFGGVTERGKPQFPFTQTLIDESELVRSEFGADFADERPQTETHAVQYRGFRKAEVELLMDAYREFGRTKSFFVTFDPDAVFSTSTNRQIRYVRFNRDPSVQLIRPDFFEVAIELRETL